MLNCFGQTFFIPLQPLVKFTSYVGNAPEAYSGHVHMGGIGLESRQLRAAKAEDVRPPPPRTLGAAGRRRDEVGSAVYGREWFNSGGSSDGSEVQRGRQRQVPRAIGQ